MQFLYTPVLFSLIGPQFQPAQLLVANKESIDDHIERRQGIALLPFGTSTPPRGRPGGNSQPIQSCKHFSITRRFPIHISIHFVARQSGMPNAIFVARVKGQILKTSAEKVERAQMCMNAGQVGGNIRLIPKFAEKTAPSIQIE